LKIGNLWFSSLVNRSYLWYNDRNYLYMALKKFHFEAISKEGKNLSGFLFSENAKAARVKLKSEGNIVLELELFVAEKKKNSDLQEFEFQAKASDGRTVHGEIEAQTQYVAYRKLRMEYDFQLEYLVVKDLPFEQKEALKKQGVDSQLKLLFEQDEEAQKTKVIKKKKVKKGKVEQMLEDREDEMHFLQAQTEVITTAVKKLLGEHSTYLNAEKQRHIQVDLDRLSRLRQSSSLNHLEQIMKRIFKQLLDNNLFIVTEDNILEVEKSQAEIRKVTKELESNLKKGISNVQIGDLQKITEKVIHMSLFRRVFMPFYWGFVFLLIMLLNFWVLTFGKLVFGQDVDRMNFYLESTPLWFLTGFSAVVMVVFAFSIFPREKPLSLVKRLILYAVAFGVLIVFTIQFPVLFFWTK